MKTKSKRKYSLLLMWNAMEDVDIKDPFPALRVHSLKREDTGVDTEQGRQD